MKEKQTMVARVEDYLTARRQMGVSRIHEMAPRRTYAEIATSLNRAGLRSAFGRRFTAQHVGYICRRDGLAKGKTGPGSNLRDGPDAGGQAKVE